jgi:hypothetical protein
MKALKIVLIVIGSLIALFIIVFGIYLLLNIQGEAESFEIGSPELDQKVLIASQGSDFKNALVDSLTTHLEEKPLYIKVVDVSALGEVKEEEWNALIIINTCQQYRLHPDVIKYLDKAKDLSKVILVITSGPGDWKTDKYDVDIFTSASKMSELKLMVSSILTRIQTILED